MTLFKFNWRFFNDLFSKCKFYFSFLFFFLFSFLFFCNSTNDHALIPEIRKLRKDAAFSQFSHSHFHPPLKTIIHITERSNEPTSNAHELWKFYRTPTLCIPFPASFASPSCHPSLPRYLCFPFATLLQPSAITLTPRCPPIDLPKLLFQFHSSPLCSMDMICSLIICSSRRCISHPEHFTSIF